MLIDGIGLKKAFLISDAIAKEKNKPINDLTIVDVIDFFKEPTPIIGIGINTIKKVSEVIGV